MTKMLIVGIAMALLSGCATSYQPKGVTGGFTETQLGENIFQVRFNGNGYTRGGRATDFALLRSAELTLEHGYRYFIIADASTETSVSKYTSPTHSTTTGTAYGSGNYAYGTAHMTTTGGQTIVTSRPSSSNTIICFDERPDITGLVFDAEYVVRSLKAKYKI